MPFLPPASVERALVSVALLPGPPPCGSSLWEGGNTSTQSRGKRAKGQDKPGLSASLGLQDKEGLAESEQDGGDTTGSGISRCPLQYYGWVEVMTLPPIWEVHTGMA